MSARLPPTPRDQLTEEQKKAYDELHDLAETSFGSKFIWKRKDGALVGPFPFLISPPDAPHAGVDMLKLVAQVAKIPGLPTDAKETAILATGSVYGAKYELYAHSNVATKTDGGLSPEAATALCAGRKPEELSEAATVAFDVAKYLSGTLGALPQELWDRSQKVLGKEGTVALVHYVGLYAYTCIILNAMDADVPKDDD